jgi:hypothetical protein
MKRFPMLRLAALSILGMGGCAQTADNPASYTVLDDAATQLRADFNRDKGKVRLLFVVDPICPGCLRGLDDVDATLLKKTSDANLQTYVVHVPVLGAKAKDVAPATKLINNTHVRHYWNESGAFGGLVSNAVDLRSKDGKWVYAWDVWLIYGPEASWDGPMPPKPRLLMQQLWALQGSERFPNFDSEAFAQEVQKVLHATPTAASQ